MLCVIRWTQAEQAADRITTEKRLNMTTFYNF